MPEFVRVELRRTLECTLILRHIMVLLRIRVNVPLTLTRGPGKHGTTKRQTDVECTTPHTSLPVVALPQDWVWAGCGLTSCPKQTV